MYRVTWLTGQSGAGKTTIAKELQKDYSCVILDGNEMRDSISLGAGFSPDERSIHNYRVARLAKVLSGQTNIIVAVIAPVAKTRWTIDTNYPMITFVYLKKSLPDRDGHFYEEPTDYPIIDTDKLTICESVERLKEIIGLIENKTHHDNMKTSCYTI